MVGSPKKEGSLTVELLTCFKNKKKNKKKVIDQRSEENKRKRKVPDQRSEENKRNIQKGLWTRKISEQHRIVTSKQEKKGNHDLKWSSPFDHQPKSCALATFSPRTKQKQRRKRPKHSKPNFPQKINTIPEKVLLIHDHTCNL